MDDPPALSFGQLFQQDSVPLVGPRPSGYWNSVYVANCYSVTFLIRVWITVSVTNRPLGVSDRIVLIHIWRSDEVRLDTVRRAAVESVHTR